MGAERTYELTDDGEQIDKLIDTGTPPNDPARVQPHSAYRHLNVTLADGTVVNDDTDDEAVSIEIIDGLEVVRGTTTTDATVLDYNGDVTISVDGAEMTKTLSNGSVSFDVTTEKPAGSTIKIVAETLGDHPAESDSATIEVVSP